MCRGGFADPRSETITPVAAVGFRARFDAGACEAFFPEKLEAIVMRGDQVELQPAAIPSLRSNQALLVEFTRGEETVRILAYGGRRVCVNLGSRVCFRTVDDQLWRGGDHC